MTDSDPITRLNAALEGRYRIERELGEGGMANVYLADDLKHERKVALKVLKPELAAVVGAERFLAEIKTTANLSHPHILPLFDSGEADGFLFYVMPHVEGESLRDRLDREHQLPVGDAVKLATNLAEALDYAHGQGVIHRDIKPANVLLQAGKPVISDFGIALAVGTAGQGRLTETGLSMGTPHYMSPEQATGDLSVGAATDIYALGCVLYEMLVGEPPYTGSTAQAILGKIIAGKVASATEARASVPANVDAAIRKALEKVPADRFGRVNDLAKALADPGFRHGETAAAGSAAGAGPWNPLSMVLGALALVLGLGLSWALLRPEPPQPVERFAEDLGVARTPGISPDGSALVFVGAAADGGGQQLWLRRWEVLTPTPIAGTEGPAVGAPVISPTGEEVAFIVNRRVDSPRPTQLKVAPLDGGGVRTLVESTLCCTRWGPDGFIYYSTQGVINRVLATGGVVEVVTKRDQEGDGQHVDFQVLPGREVAVFSVISGSTWRVEAMRLNTGERKVLTPGKTPYVTSTGHLVFASVDGQILAAPFDAENMELTGAAVPLVRGVVVRDADYSAYSLSQSGTLVYLQGAGGAAPLEFVWVTRSGEATPVDSGHTFPSTESRGWRLSPDETRIAFNYSVNGNNDVRIKHLPDGPEERITFGPEIDARPFWTPDGQSVTYFSGTGDSWNVWSSRADGTGEPVLVLDDQSYADGEWSPDGEWLVLRSFATTAGGGSRGARDILTFRPGVDSAAVPKVATPEFREGEPSFSADGRWLAYSSNETDRSEVYVRPFPNVDSTRVRVSANGGGGPFWSKSGSELFFVDANRGLVAAQFDLPSGRVLEQETLFTMPPGQAGHDVSLDGERFLMVRPYAGDGEEVPSRYIVVQNWFEELKRLVPN